MAMAQGYHALSAKEKEALRLLVNGHDAKSMARHLGLSVHTIHERLRDARRKLGASSSREAARLLREAEVRLPENSGDTELGAARGGLRMEQVTPSIRQSGQGGRIGWMIGGCVMSLTLALLALTALNGGTEPARPADPGVESAPGDTRSAVVGAARQWLALVDARDWNGSWRAAASGIRTANTVEQWTSVVARVHGQFGAARSRDVVLVEEIPAPPNGYWLVRFKANYANKPQGIETLTLAREEGVWKVSGITVD